MSFHSPLYTKRNCSSSPYKEVIVPSPTHHSRPTHHYQLNGIPSSAPILSQPISIPSRQLIFSEPEQLCADSSNGFSYLPPASPTTTTFQQSSQAQFNHHQHSNDVIYENEVNRFSNKSDSSENIALLFDFQLDEEIGERYHNFNSAHLSPLHQNVYPHKDQFVWSHSEPARTSRRVLYTSPFPSPSSLIHTTNNRIQNPYSWERRTRSCSGKL